MDIAAIEQAYRRYAGIYDLCFGAVFQPGRRVIVDRMNCAPGERILEVGVGTGLSLPLYPAHVRVTGIDISRPMLERACARRARSGLHYVTQLLRMDAEDMSFEDNAFDRVVAMHVASVVTDPLRLVAEMRRVCKPNGQLVFVNHFSSRNAVIGRLESLLSPLAKQLGFHPDFSLERFLARTGLEALRIHPVNLFHFCTVVEARNNKPFSTEMLAPLCAA